MTHEISSVILHQELVELAEAQLHLVTLLACSPDSVNSVTVRACGCLIFSALKWLLSSKGL